MSPETRLIQQRRHKRTYRAKHRDRLNAERRLRRYPKQIEAAQQKLQRLIAEFSRANLEALVAARWEPMVGPR